MTRSLLLGLVWLALLVIPYEEVAAHSVTGEPDPLQTEAEVSEGTSPEPVLAPESVVPPDQPPPGETSSTTTVPGPELTAPVNVSKMLLQNDLAPGAEIVTGGQPLAIE